MSDHNEPFPDEEVHLSQVNEKLEEAVGQAEKAVEKLDKEYMDAKRYMADYRGELDPHEMFQNELLLRQTDHTGAFSVEVRNRLIRLKESPYFSRIDFRTEGKSEAACYEAPGGRIEGELTKKRQFKIKNGVMEYALETSANVQDDILQRELSHTSDEKMKSIVCPALFLYPLTIPLAGLRRTENGFRPNLAHMDNIRSSKGLPWRRRIYWAVSGRKM